MPRINLYEILYRGGLSPEERIQREAQRERERALRRLDEEYRYAAEKTLREATLNFANDPYGFSLMMFREYSAMADNLDEVIEELGDEAGVQMLQTRDKFREEANKYWAVITAIDGITRARVKGDAEKENYYQERLSNYAVVYDTEPTGEIRTMRIESIAALPSKSYPTNIGITVAGTPEDIKIIAADIEKTPGMRVFVRGISPDFAPQIRLGGFVLNWAQPIYKVTATGDALRRGRKEINWDFGLQRIRRTSFINKPPGSVVKDSKGKMYYVNYDGSLSLIKSRKLLERLGVDFEQVYPLDPWEEETLPPEEDLAKRRSDPVLDLISKYEAEAEEIRRKYTPHPLEVKAGEIGQKIYEKLHLEKLERFMERTEKRAEELRQRREKIPSSLTERIKEPAEPLSWSRFAEPFKSLFRRK
ncbi:MAG: hypothetical protein DRN12_07340 [Thermoplasmata archaeon]|nr:MAG: hypothetical protein DRN12_07340 [Thermoplasmata archaeon]